mgnify:FL=1
MKKKFQILKITIFLVFIIITTKLFFVQIIDKNKYISYVYNNTHTFWYSPSVPRGKIYDRNNKIIVDNEAIKTLYYIKNSENTLKKEIEIAYNLAKNIDIDYTTLSKNNYENFLKISKYNDDELTKKTAYIYYLMNAGYSFAPKLIKKDINDKEYVYLISANLNGILVNNDWKRKYESSFKSLIGNIASIPYENKAYYLNNGYSLSDKVGVSYLEKIYENTLKGHKSKYEIKDGNLILIEPGKKGNDIYLTIDIDLQNYLDNLLEEELIKTKKEYNTKYFNKIFVVIVDPNNGDILAISGKQIIKTTTGYKVYDYTPGTFLNSYTSGSVVKGASHIVGYNTNSLKIGEKRYDTCLKIGTINKCSWTYLGYINDIDALKYSSNTYQFRTAINVGKGKYEYNKPLSIDKNAFNIYRKVFNSFGLGSKTGIEFDEVTGIKGTSTLPGFLLDLAIGQYDTYTPIELAQYISSLAIGKRYKLKIVKKINDKIIEDTVLNEIKTEKKYLDRVRLGFREAAINGLGVNYIYYKGAGKTGTAETFTDSNNDGIVDTPTINKTFVGYFPYDSPKYAFSIVAPDISFGNSYGSNINQRISYNITKKIYEMYLK